MKATGEVFKAVEMFRELSNRNDGVEVNIVPEMVQVAQLEQLKRIADALEKLTGCIDPAGNDIGDEFRVLIRNSDR